jgi:hypothetical protein
MGLWHWLAQVNAKKKIGRFNANVYKLTSHFTNNQFFSLYIWLFGLDRSTGDILSRGSWIGLFLVKCATKEISTPKYKIKNKNF